MKKQTNIKPIFIFLFLISILFISGCALPPPATPAPTPIFRSKQVNLSGMPEAGPGEIKIGAWNVQIFGPKKSSDPEIMNILSQSISNYDIIAIQEIRDSSGTAIMKLMNTPDLRSYTYVMSPRLGRSTSKEQYAIIYDVDEITYFENSAITYPDTNDVFEREPYMARFKAGSFDFVMIVIHVKPEDATNEIKALNTVLIYAQTKYATEQDFIIAGDLNSDCSYFEGPALTNLNWLISDNADTTVRASTDCAYDRIIVTKSVSPLVSSAGVDRFDIPLNLLNDQTLKVSDHYPVYANVMTG